VSNPDAAEMQVYRANWKRRRRDQRERIETLRRRWAQAARDAVARVAPRFPVVARVYLFGSFAQGGMPWAESDLDLGIEPRPDGETYWALAGELQREIGGPIVDLVILDDGLAFGDEVRERGS